MTRVVIHDAALRDLVNDPTGGIARELRDQAERIAEAAKTHLSAPQPPRQSGVRQINESKVPWMRSGDLVKSVHVLDTPRHNEEGLITYDVVADAVHSGVHYGRILREQDFRLAPDSIFNR